MDNIAPALPSPKHRKSYTPDFKAKVVKDCDEPGNSVAVVARHYSLNANLVHWWRREQQAKPPQDEFLRLSVPKPATQASKAMVRLELPGKIIVYWPIERLADSSPWLKALMS